MKYFMVGILKIALLILSFPLIGLLAFFDLIRELGGSDNQPYAFKIFDWIISIGGN